MSFEWTRSNTLALARQRCEFCHGLGLAGATFTVPCKCVLRSIFRICHDRFVDCVQGERLTRGVSLEIHSGPERRGTWGLKQEEYLADFILLAKRNLDEDDYKLFRYRFLLGVDWKLCATKLGIDRGTCFNRIYSIMQRLGRAFAELEPYPMFPLAEYFHTTHRSQRVGPSQPPDNRVLPIRPPVQGQPDEWEDPGLKAA